MRTLKHKLDNFTVNYPLEHIAPLDKILFLDIETTGFTAKNASIYLIGAAYYEENSWHVIQWFATNYDEEKDILTEFYLFHQNYEHFLHFNGNTFDLPFIKQRGACYDIPFDFSIYEGTDIYKRVAPYKAMLQLERCKQKDIELFLGIQRDDLFSGGELIEVYKRYVENPDDISFQALIQHNLDDMKGMLSITPILAYHDLFHTPVKAKQAQANYYTDIHGVKRQELIMRINHPAPLPVPLSLNHNSCYYSGEGKSGTLRIPLYEEEMKYFYSNYKDYYYLPAEDTALHKSVAGFVDKMHRLPAQAANCYTRKRSTYLPEWDTTFEPFFKRDYASKELFFELTEEFKSDRKVFSTYAQHVLQMLAVNNK
ncbi:MAG: ribonuclease H-like domain-containing protein [Lachnospiraceae bacterium]|nr:ribonuclease H-like domain-containing protein [Lachnospiraceae bacterium]